MVAAFTNAVRSGLSLTVFDNPWATDNRGEYLAITCDQKSSSGLRRRLQSRCDVLRGSRHGLGEP